MSERQIRRVGGGCWGERRSERNENEGRSDTLELHPIYMSHHPKEGCTEARPGLSEPPRLNGAIYFKKEINRLKPFSVNIVGVRCQALGSCRGRVLGGETGLLRGKKDELSVRARVYGIVRKLCCDREFMRQD